MRPEPRPEVGGDVSVLAAGRLMHDQPAAHQRRLGVGALASKLEGQHQRAVNSVQRLRNAETHAVLVVARPVPARRAAMR